MNLYHVIYSLFYSLSKKMNGADNAPVYNACLGLSIIVLLNLATAILVIDLIFGSTFFLKIAEVPVSYFVLSNILFFTINYFYFKNKNISHFYGINICGKHIASVYLAVMYVVATVLLFGLMMSVRFHAGA